MNIIKVSIITLSLIMTACGSSSSGNKDASVPNDRNCQDANYNQQFNTYTLNNQNLNCNNFQGTFNPNNGGYIYNGNGFTAYGGINWNFIPQVNYYGGTGLNGNNYPTYDPYQANGQPITNQEGQGCEVRDWATGAIVGGILGYAVGDVLGSFVGGTAGAALDCLVFD